MSKTKEQLAEAYKDYLKAEHISIQARETGRLGFIAGFDTRDAQLAQQANGYDKDGNPIKYSLSGGTQVETQLTQVEQSDEKVARISKLFEKL